MSAADEQEDATAFLTGIRIIELADELGEYCGKLLAGIGADVIKVEPPAGERTRTYGPFYADVPNLERSLHFWHYNFGKRSVTLDLDTEAGVARLRDLIASADVLLDTRPRGYLAERGLTAQALRSLNPALIHARITPFGDDGPWADYQGSDLVHLALGGVMMNCGYDPDPFGEYDTPPIAPQMWQAYSIAGEMAAIGVLGALTYRLDTGVGQVVSVPVHEAVSKNTETDLPNWIFLRQEHHRQTCRHSMPTTTGTPSLARTKDGRWLQPYRTYLPGSLVDAWQGTLRLLRTYGMEGDLDDPKYAEPAYRAEPHVRLHISAHTDALIARLPYSRDLWREAQAEGMPWAPIRRPEENLAEEHWQCRETFLQVAHPELGETFTYVGAKWLAPGLPWRRGPRAPLLGEHTDAVLRELGTQSSPRGVASPPPGPSIAGGRAPRHRNPVQRRQAPFALAGVRVIDLSWLLASGGAGRFFTAMGAEVIKIEHSSRTDPMRWGQGIAPVGGRAERDRAASPIPTPEPSSPNQGGSFMEINAGKRSLSLNLKHPRAKELLAELISDADIVIEGFSPGTMDRMGFGYDRLRVLNPRIIYVQQSGMGQIGTYGQLRSYGPTAQGFSGLSDMSGLPEPFQPAGIGYSYLDWFGAYNMATAMMAALYRCRRTGEGCYIDSSQVETGTYLNGTAILDFSVNGRRWSRYGNRSPYKPAAPHGAFRSRGKDRWIAIACFSDAHWTALVHTLGNPAWGHEPRFADLDSRLRHQDELEILVEAATVDRDGYELMTALQAEGVPAGVCQTAADRCERDPQLDHLGWLVELEQSELGQWPVKELPIRMSETPPYIGGTVNRSGPSYGEDNDYVLREILGLDDDEIHKLALDGVL